MNVFSRWSVSAHGYKWENFEGIEEDILTDGIPVGVPFRQKLYYPMEYNKALYKNFAEIKPTKEDVLKFANKYGMLGGTVGIKISLPDPENPSQDCFGKGETFEEWCKQIKRMKRMVELTEAINKEDIKKLKEYIQIKKYAVIYNYEGLFHAVYPHTSSMFKDFTEGEYIKPAKEVLRHIINKQLEAKIKHLEDDWVQLKEYVSPKMLWDKGNGQLQVFATPNSLLSTMWLQLALAVNGDRVYRRCTSCNLWFEVGSNSERKNKLYCGGACRAKSYRTRKEKARNLFKNGHSAVNIAEILNVQKEKILKWVNEG